MMQCGHDEAAARGAGVLPEVTFLQQLVFRLLERRGSEGCAWPCRGVQCWCGTLVFPPPWLGPCTAQGMQEAGVHVSAEAEPGWPVADVVSVNAVAVPGLREADCGSQEWRRGRGRGRGLSPAADMPCLVGFSGRSPPPVELRNSFSALLESEPAGDGSSERVELESATAPAAAIGGTGEAVCSGGTSCEDVLAFNAAVGGGGVAARVGRAARASWACCGVQRGHRWSLRGRADRSHRRGRGRDVLTFSAAIGGPCEATRGGGAAVASCGGVLDCSAGVGGSGEGLQVVNVEHASGVEDHALVSLAEGTDESEAEGAAVAGDWPEEQSQSEEDEAEEAESEELSEEDEAEEGVVHGESCPVFCALLTVGVPVQKAARMAGKRCRREECLAGRKLFLFKAAPG